MVSVFGSTGIGFGIDCLGRAAGGTPQTLVASVHIIGHVTSKWTFDYPIGRALTTNASVWS